MKGVWMKMYRLALRLIFYKQLGSGFSSQSCLQFRGFWSSKLLNGCLVVWSSNLFLPGMQQFLGFQIQIYDQRF